MAAFGPESDPDIDPVIVVGMGPGGLAAAITAAQNGLPVVIVENRDHFSRIQRLHADGRTMQFLQSLHDPNNLEDKAFFEKKCFGNKKPDGTLGDAVVQVKDIQKFLARKLAAYPNVEIRMGKGHEITAVDPDSQTLVLSKPDGSTSNVKFSHMVAADGARRGVTRFLNASPNQNYHIEHTPMALQPRQSQAGTVALQVKAGQTIPDTPGEASGSNFNLSHMHMLNRLGWDQQYFPKVRVFRNEENTKFFFSGEIPRTIQFMKNKDVQKQALEEWGKFIVSVEMGIEPDLLEIPLKAGVHSPDAKKAASSKESQAMRTTAFELSLSNADKPSIELGQHGGFALVGDAFKNANFFYGHGLNDAIQDGIKAAQCIDPQNGFNFEDFNVHQQRQLRQLNVRMNLEESGPSINLPPVFAKMNDDAKRLLALAKKMHDPEISTLLKDTKGMAQPGEKGFDGRLYAMQMDSLIARMTEYVNSKLSAPRKGSKFINMSGDKNKFSSMSNEVDILAREIKRDLTNYFKSNNENKSSWAQQLAEAAESSPAKPQRRTPS